MNKTGRRALKILLALGFVVGLTGGTWSAMDHRKSDEAYSAAEELAGLSGRQEAPSAPEEPENEGDAKEADPYAGELAQTDLDALREVNRDIIGWITIPETELSYPIVQGEDNDYYLNHTWERDRSSMGSIFLEYRASPDLSDFNTTIYGHRMRNGSMFGSLKYYEDICHWKAHPSVYIVADSGVHRYDIFAAYEVDTEAIVYELGISSPTKKQMFIQFGLERSIIDTGVKPTALDRILTLSTCTGRGYSTRWVVQAVLWDGESA